MKTRFLIGAAFVIVASLNAPFVSAATDYSKQMIAQRDQGEHSEQRAGEPRGNRGAQRATPSSRAGVQPYGVQRGARRGPAPGTRNRVAIQPREEHGPALIDKRAFQRNITAPRRYRIGAYHAPRDWRYRRWTYGEFLPVAFWARNFWLTTFWLYGLDRPPFGTEWVRYGPDALLVDVTTGEILEVEYNVFY